MRGIAPQRPVLGMIETFFFKGLVDLKFIVACFAI
jgi:hypothetical protein